MRNAMSWIKSLFSKDSLIIVLISICLLTLINFFFVYNSPTLIKLIPNKIVQFISPCYRTLFHHDRGSFSQTNFVFGDSFSEGSGDEFLNSDPQYGIFNKLHISNESELIFGRGGHGNRGTVIEFKQCFPLLSSFTNLSLSEIKNYNVTFVFYEGNDLNNNLVEEDRKVYKFIYKIKFFFPLYEYVYKEIRQKIYLVYQKLRLNNPIPVNEELLPISQSGIKIKRYPQSAATELSKIELKKSINIFFKSLANIRKELPNAQNYNILYLPSVAASYHLDGIIRVQSYKEEVYFETTGEFNADRSIQIREFINSSVTELGWNFCDTTNKILNTTSKGHAVHGPKDWKHFNKLGYNIVAQSYKQCFLPIIN